MFLATIDFPWEIHMAMKIKKKKNPADLEGEISSNASVRVIAHTNRVHASVKY